jgi:hypothetical protein
MRTSTVQSEPAVSGPPPGVFRWRSLLLWLACSILSGVTVGWLAAVAQRYAAPAFVFPLVTGLALGWGIILLIRWLQVGHRATILAGTLVAALSTMAAEHAVTYFQYRQQIERRRELALERAAFPDRLPPSDFGPYFAWQSQQTVSIFGASIARRVLWPIDGLLILAPALLLAAIAAGHPYCNRCRTWYRIVRGGRLTDAAFRQIAARLDLEAEPTSHAAHYRMNVCQGGCGPTGLSLSWEQNGCAVSAGLIWLSPNVRNELLDILDAEITAVAADLDAADLDAADLDAAEKAESRGRED